MALPSLAPRPQAPRSEPVTLADPEHVTAAPPSAAARIVARLKSVLADPGDSRLAQLVAGKVFLVRVGSALLALGSQVLLARWMGSFEFGIYIYVWTWVLMIGALSDVGLSSAARRFIPEYIELKSFDRLRGFLAGSRWLAFAIATAIGVVGALGVTLLAPWLDHFVIIPLYLACVTIPIYGLVQVQAGIAQSYDWPNLALMPFYIWRQLAITVLMGADLARRRADQRRDGDDRRCRHDLGRDHGPAGAAQSPPQGKGAGRPEDLRGKDLVCHVAADFRRRRLLPAADLCRHYCDRAFRLAARCRGLLCRRAIARDRRLRLFRHRRRHDPQIHRISRVRRPAAPCGILQRDHPLDILAVAHRLRAQSLRSGARCCRCSAPASSQAMA